MNATNPPRVIVKREHFFGDRAFAPYARASAFQSAWKLGGKQWSQMRKAGRALLRVWMRDAALEAVRRAKEDAAREAALIS